MPLAWLVWERARTMSRVLFLSGNAILLVRIGLARSVDANAAACGMSQAFPLLVRFVDSRALTDLSPRYLAEAMGDG